MHALSSSSTGTSGDGSNSEWLERAVENLSPQNTLVVMNKTDLLDDLQRSQLEQRLSLEIEVCVCVCVIVVCV